MNLLITSHFISYLLPLSIGITTFVFFGIFLFLNHYGFLFNFNSKASIATSLASPQIYMAILLVCFLNFVFDYTIKLFKLYFNDSLSSKLILNKSPIKKGKRSNNSNNNNKINFSKYSKNKHKKRFNSVDNEIEKSNNHLISKSSEKKINFITPNKNYLNLNYIPKISKFQEGANYKNEFYSLKILQNINNKNLNNNNNTNNNIYSSEKSK